MIRTSEWVPNPDHNPADPASKPGTRVYGDLNHQLRENDIVQFTCNGRGRGGHYSVYARVTKIKRKTFDALEIPRSYSPGTRWNLLLDDPNRGELIVHLSWHPLITDRFPDGLNLRSAK